MHYSLNEIYHFSNVRGKGDQYMDWFAIGNKAIANQGGIRSRTFWNKHKLKIPYNIPSLIVLVSNNHEKDQSVNPWDPAELNETTGQLIYKGDSRKYKKNTEDRDPRSKLEHQGNKQFRKIEQILITENKIWLPPLLYFSSVSMGEYAFKGLYYPNKITSYFDESPYVEKENYKLHCQRLDDKTIPLEWLRDRCLVNTEPFDFDKSEGPSSWNQRDI